MLIKLDGLRLTISTHRWSLLGLGFVWFVFFSRTILDRGVYFLDDLEIIYWPLEYLYASCQHSWRLPVWSTLVGFGHPLLAWGQLGFFNAWHMFMRAVYIPPLTLLQVSILSYFGIGLFGMFLFLRYQRLSQTAAVLGAMVFAFSGFNIGHLNHVNFYTTTMVLPWLLLAISAMFTRPNVRRSAVVAIIAAQMALSGQPQILLYSFFIAGLWALVLLYGHPKKIKSIVYLVAAGLLAFCLASLAILPLAEFLPITDRAGGITREELMEFSYPPWHLITLLFPYFYGDHTIYWGAKNFQELAAYCGIIPLMLAGLGFYKKEQRRLQIVAVMLIIIGAALALGKYSPLYTWLVYQGIIKSISVPGRFVWFIDIGLAILAAIGLDGLWLIGKKRMAAVVWAVLPVVGVFIIFMVHAVNDQPDLSRFWYVIGLRNIEPYLLASGGITVLLSVIMTKKQIWKYCLAALTAVTLISYGWNYNPLTTRQQAYSLSPFIQPLLDWQRETGKLPRIYQTTPPTINQQRTEQISSRLAIYQPITLNSGQLDCLRLWFSTDDKLQGEIKVDIRESLAGNPIRSATIQANQLRGTSTQLCVMPIKTKPFNNRLIVSFSSEVDSGLRLIQERENREEYQAYFVRRQQLSTEQVISSRKPVRILLEPEADYDPNYLALGPHMNVLANASSANWIGALAIKPYRMLVTTILADGEDQVDGDGQHVINKHRRIIDLLGITHVMERKKVGIDSNYLIQNGFEMQAEEQKGDDVITLYRNKNVLPQVWLVNSATFSPADDETIYGMMQPDWQPDKELYVAGPTPPQQQVNNEPAAGETRITRYEDKTVEVKVRTERAAWLVLNDATTPQWSTYIDGLKAPYFAADTIFKTAYVPAGEHNVSFRYESRAISQAKTLTVIGLVIALVFLIWPIRLDKDQNYIT